MTDSPRTPDGQGGTSSAGNTGASFGWLAAGAIVLLSALIGGALWSIGPAGRAELLTRHAPAIIGVPAALLIATAVVCAARALAGEIKLGMLSADSTPASAMLAYWLAVFAAVVIAIRALW